MQNNLRSPNGGGYSDTVVTNNYGDTERRYPKDFFGNIGRGALESFGLHPQGRVIEKESGEAMSGEGASRFASTVYKAFSVAYNGAQVKAARSALGDYCGTKSLGKGDAKLSAYNGMLVDTEFNFVWEKIFNAAEGIDKSSIGDSGNNLGKQYIDGGANLANWAVAPGFSGRDRGEIIKGMKKYSGIFNALKEKVGRGGMGSGGLSFNNPKKFEDYMMGYIPMYLVLGMPWSDNEAVRRIVAENRKYFAGGGRSCEEYASLVGKFGEHMYGSSRAPGISLGQYHTALVCQKRLQHNSGIVAGKKPIKGACVGNKAVKGEDGNYCDFDAGLFVVFDGAGGEEGGKEAVSSATEYIKEFRGKGEIVSAMQLAMMLDEAHAVIRRGMTTAVAAKVIFDMDDKKRLLVASVGDSRCYLIRKGDARQLTEDEGEGKQIYNALGMQNKSSVCTQFFEVSLEEGDTILLCTDGVTGDSGEELVSEQEIVDAIRGKDMSGAIDTLVGRVARKKGEKDDGTAVLVNV